MIKYILIISFLFNICYAEYDLSTLNWKGSKKNYCSANVKRAIGLPFSPGNGTDWIKYKEDKEMEIGDVLVITRYNKLLKGSAGWRYGHVGIAKQFDGDKVLMYDGYYSLWLKKSQISGVIGAQKLIELGAKNINVIIPNNDEIVDEILSSEEEIE